MKPIGFILCLSIQPQMKLQASTMHGNAYMQSRYTYVESAASKKLPQATPLGSERAANTYLPHGTSTMLTHVVLTIG